MARGRAEPVRSAPPLVRPISSAAAPTATASSTTVQHTNSKGRATMASTRKSPSSRARPRRHRLHPRKAVSAGDVVVINGVPYFAHVDIAASVQGALATRAASGRATRSPARSSRRSHLLGFGGQPGHRHRRHRRLHQDPHARRPFVGYAVAAAASGDSYVYFVKASNDAGNLRVVTGQRRPLRPATPSSRASTRSSPPSPRWIRIRPMIPEWVPPRSATRRARPRRARSCSRPGRTRAAPIRRLIAATTFTKKVNWVAWGF
jgi:hypothetical protein